MEPCRFDMGCWRPLFPFRQSGTGRAARWAAMWQDLADMEDKASSRPSSRSASRTVFEHVKEDTLEVIKVTASERNSKRIMVQTVDPTVPHVELAESSGEAGSSWSRPNGTTSADVTAARKSVGEARLLGIAKCSSTQNVDVPVPHVKVLEVLQRLRAQQRCFVAPVMIERVSHQNKILLRTIFRRKWSIFFDTIKHYSENKMEQLNSTESSFIFEIILHKYSIGLMIVGKLVWQQEEVRKEDISIALMIREEFFTSELFKDTLEAISLIQRYRTMW